MKKGALSAGIVTYNNETENCTMFDSLIETTKGLNVDIYVFDNSF